MSQGLLDLSHSGLLLGGLGIVLGVIMILSYLHYSRRKYRTGQQLLRDQGVIPVNCPGLINAIIDVRIEIAWARLSKSAKLRSGKVLACAMSIRLVDELKNLSCADLEVEYRQATKLYKLIVEG